MIVAMQEHATEEQIYAVMEAMEDAGVHVHRTTGEMQTILAAVGPTAGLDLAVFEVLPGVMHVHRISSPYKLAGRAFRPQDTVIEFPNCASIGGPQVALIAGPCAIENREQIFTIAAAVKAVGGRFLRGGAFKPRSSPYSFQGLGIPGLELMREAADANGLAVVSEVMEISQIEPMLPFVDCFQVGARNMQNFNLLRELGQIRKPVLLKRGIAATVEELLLSSEYILSGGNYEVHPVRARHPHLRDLHAQHHGHFRHSGAQEAFASADGRRSIARHRPARHGGSHGQGSGSRGRRCAAGRDSSQSRQSRFRRRADALS